MKCQVSWFETAQVRLLTMRPYFFLLWVAVDERDVALTRGTALLRVIWRCGARPSVWRFLFQPQLSVHSGVPDGHLCCRRQGRARDKICKRPAQGHRRAYRAAGRRKEDHLRRYPRRLRGGQGERL